MLFGRTDRPDSTETSLFYRSSQLHQPAERASEELGEGGNVRWMLSLKRDTGEMARTFGLAFRIRALRSPGRPRAYQPKAGTVCGDRAGP